MIDEGGGGGAPVPSCHPDSGLLRVTFATKETVLVDSIVNSTRRRVKANEQTDSAKIYINPTGLVPKQ